LFKTNLGLTLITKDSLSISIWQDLCCGQRWLLVIFWS